MTRNKKIFITGGHLTPAIATISEILRRKLPLDIVFIGRKVALEGTSHPAYEEKIIHEHGLKFLPIITGRLQREMSVYTLISLAKIPLGFIQACIYCLREKPDGVISFGGYVALPVVLSAGLLRIPVLTHEQTSVPGLANRIIARIAKKICVTFESTMKDFPSGKVVYTGLPIRPELLEKEKNVHHDKPVIYITGGSTGAKSMNAMIFPLISKLTEQYSVFHQTGWASLDIAKRVQASLPQKQKDRYIISDYFPVKELRTILHMATLVVGRSGANTVIEIAILGKIALFIPLPWSAGGEQEKNAKWLVEKGTSRIFSQNADDQTRLLPMIESMISQKEHYIKSASRLSGILPRNAAERLVDELQAISCI